MKLNDLAERLKCRLEGDGEIEILRVAGIERAQSGDLTFVANPKYYPQLAATQASAVIVSESRAVAGTRSAILRSPQPYQAFAEAVGLFAHAAAPVLGLDPTAVVAAEATIGADVSIGAFVSIGRDASIGAR